jgi:hypothetical protein
MFSLPISLIKEFKFSVSNSLLSRCPFPSGLNAAPLELRGCIVGRLEAPKGSVAFDNPLGIAPGLGKAEVACIDRRAGESTAAEAVEDVFGNLDTGEAILRGIARGAGESTGAPGKREVGVLKPRGRRSLEGVPFAVSDNVSTEGRAVMAAGTPDFAVIIVALRFCSISRAEDDMLSTTLCKLAEFPCIDSKLSLASVHILVTQRSCTHAITLSAALRVPLSAIHFATAS